MGARHTSDARHCHVPMLWRKWHANTAQAPLLPSITRSSAYTCADGMSVPTSPLSLPGDGGNDGGGACSGCASPASRAASTHRRRSAGWGWGGADGGVSRANVSHTASSTAPTAAKNQKMLGQPCVAMSHGDTANAKTVPRKNPNPCDACDTPPVAGAHGHGVARRRVNRAAVERRQRRRVDGVAAAVG